MSVDPSTAGNDEALVDTGDQPVFAATIDTLRTGTGPVYANAAARTWCRRRDIAPNVPGTLLALFGTTTVAALLRAMQHADAAEATFTDSDGTLYVHAAKLLGTSGALIAFTIVSSPIVDRGGGTAQTTVVAGVDTLTGMAGADRLLEMLRSSLAAGTSTAVLHIDLDHFQRVRDTLGREFGDLLLLQFADRLRSALVGEPNVARVGEDEFVVVIGSATSDRVDALLARLVAAARRPYELAGGSVVVPVSVGVTWSDPDTGPRDAERLLREAGTALSEAKRLGRGRVQEFSDELRRRAVERVELESQLRAALAADEGLHLHYQPQVDLRTGRIVGVEALARWRRSDGSSVPPAAFVPVAEQAGLIVEVGHRVVRLACTQLAEWRRDLPEPPATVSVNLSPHQLSDPDLLAVVRDATEAAGIEPSALCFELTEALVEARAEGATILADLATLGCLIGVGGFGTVGSPLSVLRDLPIEVVKIDRGFVAGLGSSSRDGAIIESLVDLANRLGLHLIAEGVERREQAVALVEMGCPTAQGYLFARPYDAATIAAAMRGPRLWSAAR